MSAPIASVASEGGPFLIADAVAMRSWRGINDPAQYDGLCAFLDGNNGLVLTEFVQGNESFAAWEPGAGTALIYQRGRCFAIIHGAHANIADPFVGDTQSASGGAVMLRIGSQSIAVLWAPESGECITISDLERTEAAPPSGGLAIDGSVMLLPAVPGQYTCIADELALGAHKARRLRITAL